MGLDQSFDRLKPAFQESGQDDPLGIPPFSRRQDIFEDEPFQVHDEKVRPDIYNSQPVSLDKRDPA